jgi:hypothetical protein
MAKVPIAISILTTLTSFALGIAVGCSSLTDKTLERRVSEDGKFWEEISVNRGSALKPDWYSVAVGKVHPAWSDVFSRQRSDSLFSLQGPGSVTAAWTGPMS